MIIKYPKRKKSRPYAVTKIMQAYRDEHPICEACRMSVAMHTHHIVTRGAGGIDDASNFLALCPPCHTAAHAMGWLRFSRAWPMIEAKIITARIAQGKKLNE